ncbi:MAG: hypothetical protein Q9213_007519 [Squamulea squamosa]
MANKKHKIADIRTTARRTRERFRRRKNCILRKANILAKKYFADIFVIIRKNNKYFVYNSVEAADFPPAADKILEYLSTEIQGRNDFLVGNTRTNLLEESVASDNEDSVKDNDNDSEQIPANVLIVALPPTFQQFPSSNGVI